MLSDGSTWTYPQDTATVSDHYEANRGEEDKCEHKTILCYLCYRGIRVCRFCKKRCICRWSEGK